MKKSVLNKSILTRSMLIVGSLLMVALFAGSVFAWGSCSGGGRGMGIASSQDCPRYGGQNAWTDLSQEQRDELAALRQAFIDETYELRTARFTKQQEMRMLMETSEPDRAELTKISQEMADLQKQLREKRIDFLLAAKKISPDLGMGKGFGRGCSKGFKRGGQNGCPGQGNGWTQQNN